MARMYYDAPIPEPIGSAAELVNKPPAQRSRGKGTLRNAMFQIDPSQATAEHYRRWRAHYYANISLIDESVGKILDSLERAGVLDDTLIIYTSDHGDALGDHGLSYKGLFYDSMVHVPLLMRGPGVTPGARAGSLVSTIDLMPLFYQTCGLTPPDTLQGEDVSRLLADPSATLREEAFCEITGKAMVQTDRYKYGSYNDGSAELYDLQEDPHEIRNLSGDPGYAKAESEMRARLVEHWLRNQGEQARAMNVPVHPLRQAIEDEYAAQLRQEGAR
jgi:arylsulfatase A-like enzyme